MESIVNKYNNSKLQEQHQNNNNSSDAKQRQIQNIVWNRPLDSVNNECTSSVSNKEDDDDDGEEDIDALIEELENEDDENEDAFMKKYRESKMQQFYDNLKKIDKNQQSGKFGKINEMRNENELMTEILNNKENKSVIFFYLPNFEKCLELESHLIQLSSQLLNTVFYKINVQDCPFLVSKFKLKVLPCCISYDSNIRGSKVLNTLVGLPQYDDKEYTMNEALTEFLKLD